MLAGAAVAVTTIGGEGDRTAVDATSGSVEPGALVEGGPWRVLSDAIEITDPARSATTPGSDVASPGDVGQSHVYAVIPDGDDDLLAVGQVVTSDQMVAAMWRSSDGRTWHRLGDEVFGGVPDATGGGQGVYSGVWEVAERNGVLVAVGSSSGVTSGSEGASAASGGAHAALWRRNEGGVWQYLDAVLPVEDPDSAIEVSTGAVVATESGFLVAGTAFSADSSETPRLWHSADGANSWTSVETDVFPDGAFIESIASTPDMTVAVGGIDLSSATGDPLARRAAAWFSTDGGITWASGQVDVSGAALLQSPTDLVATRDGFVAVGHLASSRDGADLIDVDVVVWTSDDGRHWSPAPSPAFNGPDRYDLVWGVEALPDGRIVVAVNTEGVFGSASATTLVGTPERLEVVANSQGFVFRSLSSGLVRGQVIAGTNARLVNEDEDTDLARLLTLDVADVGLP